MFISNVFIYKNSDIFGDKSKDSDIFGDKSKDTMLFEQPYSIHSENFLK